MRFQNIIIGAGISGLSLGWYLKEQQKGQTSILEADNRVGGWIKSDRSQGFLFEQGPHSCRTRGTGLETLRLIEDLNLCEEVISASPAAKKRYIYWEGKLEIIPNSIGSFFISSLMKDLLLAFGKEWRVPLSATEDESVKEFISRRLNGAIAEKLIDPLVSGIYAGDISKLSLRSCFPEMHRLEQEHGSLLKGMFRKKRKENSETPFVQAMRSTSIFSFVDGMETIVLALHSQLKESIQLSSNVKSLSISHDAIDVELHDGRILKGDRIFLTVPSYVGKKLLQNIDDGTISEEMDKIPYATVAVVNMGWNQKVLKQEGFGYLVPSSQKQDILGIVFDSSALAQQNGHDNETRLTVMLGGMHYSEIENLSKGEIKEKAFRALRKHMGVIQEPEAFHVTLAKHAIPQYIVGHEARIRRIEKRLDKASNSRIVLLGNALRGVSVNDCISEAKKVSLRNDNNLVQETF